MCPPPCTGEDDLHCCSVYSSELRNFNQLIIVISYKCMFLGFAILPGWRYHEAHTRGQSDHVTRQVLSGRSSHTQGVQPQRSWTFSRRYVEGKQFTILYTVVLVACLFTVLLLTAPGLPRYLTAILLFSCFWRVHSIERRFPCVSLLSGMVMLHQIYSTTSLLSFYWHLLANESKVL